MMVQQKKDYFWNSLAGIINASEAVIMSMVVTRFGLLADAGVLSLAFAIGNVLMTIGKFGGRMYQVTDAKKQYSFYMYIIQRFLTLGMMIISLIGYLIYKGYDSGKNNAIILISIIFMVEAIEDCFWGYYQADGRLFTGAQMFSVRWIAVLISFSTVMIISHNMSLSLLAGMIVGISIFMLWIVYFFKRETPNSAGFWNDFNGKITFNWLPALFGQTIPLFFASFCSIFISNIPKFAIDRHMTDEIQACYGFVAMPVFVIGLLNQFIYQPTVVHLTEEYYDNKIDVFRHNVRKQMLFVAGIAFACVVGASLIGIPILSVIYHTDLSGYWRELVILQISGGFLALSGYFSILLTIMRRQRIIMAGYIITLIVGIVVLNQLVAKEGTIGASVGYAVLMCFLFLFYYFAYRLILVRMNYKGN